VLNCYNLGEHARFSIFKLTG